MAQPQKLADGTIRHPADCECPTCTKHSQSVREAEARSRCDAEALVASRDATQTEREKPTQKAVRACADWLSTCLTLGWRKADLDALEALWWKYHDRRGELIQAPPDPPASAGVRAETLLSAFREARDIVALYLEECGPCDHSVNICTCQLKWKLEEFDHLLAALPAAGRVPHREACHICGGKGEEADYDPVSGWARGPCGHCGGTGYDPDPAGDRPPAPQGWQAPKDGGCGTNFGVDCQRSAWATWQPIETAPKDGKTWVLVTGCNTSPLVLVAGWRPLNKYGDGRWVAYGHTHVAEPTHWMPLPDPPSAGLDRSPRPDPQTEEQP